jgi:hypothetical protein
MIGVHGFKGSRFWVQGSERIKVSGFGCQLDLALLNRINNHPVHSTGWREFFRFSGQRLG